MRAVKTCVKNDIYIRFVFFLFVDIVVHVDRHDCMLCLSTLALHNARVRIIYMYTHTVNSREGSTERGCSARARAYGVLIELYVVVAR